MIHDVRIGRLIAPRSRPQAGGGVRGYGKARRGQRGEGERVVRHRTAAVLPCPVTATTMHAINMHRRIAMFGTWRREKRY